MTPSRRLFTRLRSRRPSRTALAWAAPSDPGESTGPEEASTEAFQLEDQFNELEHLRTQHLQTASSASSVTSSPVTATVTASRTPSVLPTISPHFPTPTSAASPSLHPPLPRDPTGWERFARSTFPTQLLVFSTVLAAGMLVLKQDPPSLEPALPTAVPAKKPHLPRLKPEAFDWLTQLRETNIISSQLEQQFLDAQAFYRDYALDEFLDYDPWQLDNEEVIALRHFCDHGFFTVEREILIKLLEQQLFSDDDNAIPSTVTERLAAAVTSQQRRVTGLREAVELYRRGQDEPVMIHQPLTPEQAQLQRAELVDRLAAVKKARADLDARIAELQELLKARKAGYAE